MNDYHTLKWKISKLESKINNLECENSKMRKKLTMIKAQKSRDRAVYIQR